MKSIVSNLFIAATVLSLTAACSRSVTRMDPSTTTDISGRWNDSDSRLTAEAIGKDCLNARWRGEYEAANKKKPVVIVGIITNRSSEHIEAETFVKDIQIQFINAGTVRVVQNSVLREAIRKERGDQAQFANPETQKKFGKELGADFMMFGTINSIEDGFGNKKTISYKVNLELVNMETNEIVWIGNKDIKKFVKN